jgi:hypothetical protein
LLATFLLTLSIFSPVAAGPPLIVERADDPPPSQPDACPSMFLPLVMTRYLSYTVSGQVKDVDDLPMSGVTITSDSGQSTTTDANGVYSMSVAEGERQIQADETDQNFDPSPAWVKVNQDTYNVNFSAGAACTTPIPNPSFEVVPLYWNPISGSANGYTPYYTSSLAHTGSWSGFTGIPAGGVDKESWSRWRTHEITIPSDATSADVTLFYYPISAETLRSAAKMPDFSGFNSDSPELPATNDAQYVYVTDTANNWLSTLIWSRRNDSAWVDSGTLSLMAFVGQTIKLEFGTYNNGYAGVSSAFFDDVVVTVCNGVSPSGCTNLLVNSDFETPASGWTIRTALTPSEYTTSFFYSPLTSMLSGVPVGSPYPEPGVWRTGEFYQEVTIPANATSAWLKVRLLPRSTDLWGYHIAEQAAMDAMLKSGAAPEAMESQYGAICINCDDPHNPYTLRQLFKWFPIDSAYWLYREFDLIDFRGYGPIGILFGACNDGFDGNTALYVDDAYMEVCVP